MVLLLAACRQEEKVYELTCDYKFNPVGLDSKYPKFSWKIKSDGFSKHQTAYRILVSDKKGEIFWDTRCVKSDQSILIPYSGKPLQSGTSYSWKVKVWDEEGVALKWSKSATWTTGIMHADEWKAEWIGAAEKEPVDAAPFIRKEFTVAKKVEKAYAYISGLGYYELRINGKKIGDNVLDPAQTDYEKRVFYTV